MFPQPVILDLVILGAKRRGTIISRIYVWEGIHTVLIDSYIRKLSPFQQTKNFYVYHRNVITSPL